MYHKSCNLRFACCSAKNRQVPGSCSLWLDIHPDNIKWCKWKGRSRRIDRFVFVCVKGRGGYIWGVACLSLRPACHVQHQSCSFTAVLFHPPLPLVLWWQNSLIQPCGKGCCLVRLPIRINRSVGHNPTWDVANSRQYLSSVNANKDFAKKKKRKKIIFNKIHLLIC